MNIESSQFILSVARLEQLPKDNLPEVAFAGRSNVGKSSLINCLLGRKKLALTSATPGKTRLLNYYLINRKFYLVDLPGYGFARVPLSVKEEWGELIEGYLGARDTLKGVIVITDARHDMSPLDIQMIEWLSDIGVPIAVIATKVDKLSKNKADAQLQRGRRTLDRLGGFQLIPFSAVTKTGRKEVLSALYHLIEN